MEQSTLDLDLAADTIRTIRFLSADAVEAAASGHPGTPMEAATIGYLLYRRHLRHNPANPGWWGRDRFVLSCGHASMLLYSLLHLCGYDLSLEKIRNFRQLGSGTPGHPEFPQVPGCETTTGPLGQGASVAVGMAMGGRLLAENLDEHLFDGHIYALCSDGDLMEGVTSEAASLAGHLSLGNLTCIYLDNHITIEGPSSLSFSEEVATRYLAYGWRVIRVEGDNVLEVDEALSRSRLSLRPTLIIARTHIAMGAPGKQDSASAHGAPLGAEELRRAKLLSGWDPEASFQIPGSVQEHMAQVAEHGAFEERLWSQCFSEFKDCATELQLQMLEMMAGELPPGWEAQLPVFCPSEGPMATRKASGRVLEALAPRLPLLVGGSADLAPSNNTELVGERYFVAGRSGRNIHFGVREHAMGAILNGLAHMPGILPFGGTFLVFSDYMRPPMRLAALMGLAPVYVFTHDSIALGEDGPTHQPVEQLAALRAVPNLVVIRPCDANELSEAWRVAIERRNGPTALVLSRQELPILARSCLGAARDLERGAYVLAPEQGELQLILIATGSDVHLALEARVELQRRAVGVRVVSLPCWEIFDAQGADYSEAVLPGCCKARVAIEAASPMGWERYVGLEGRIISMKGFGASAPAKDLLMHFGFSVDRIVHEALDLLRRA